MIASENTTEKLEREEAAISKVLNADGTQLTVTVPMIQPPIHVAVWRVDVGRVPHRQNALWTSADFR
ncbi:MAG: hypothetical protein PVG35_05970 [Desulfobacterales bacterium]|jgi:starch phosphorylase